MVGHPQRAAERSVPRPGTAPPQRAPVGFDPIARQFLTLQATFGNRSVTALLGRADPLRVQRQGEPVGPQVAGNPLVGLKRGDGLVFGTFDRRTRVRALQERLNAKVAAGLDEDGMFGPADLGSAGHVPGRRGLANRRTGGRRHRRRPDGPARGRRRRDRGRAVRFRGRRPRSGHRGRDEARPVEGPLRHRLGQPAAGGLGPRALLAAWSDRHPGRAHHRRRPAPPDVDARRRCRHEDDRRRRRAHPRSRSRAAASLSASSAATG